MMAKTAICSHRSADPSTKFGVNRADGAGKADQDMSLVRREDISRFRDDQAKRVSAVTANNFLKIARIIFAAAEADGVIHRNEAKFVKKLKVRGAKSALI